MRDSFGKSCRLRVEGILLGQVDVVAIRKVLNRIDKREVLMLHDKAENVPSGTAAKAMIHLAVRIDIKRWCFLVVKGTQADMAGAGSTQRNDLTDHFHNINSLLHQGG